MSRGTVQNRMRRLVEDGTIVGRAVRLRPDVEEHHLRAPMTIAVEGNRTAAIVEMLGGDPAVKLKSVLRGLVRPGLFRYFPDA
jgi:DNA-binding Lrp family transcriptional regulator